MRIVTILTSVGFLLVLIIQLAGFVVQTRLVLLAPLMRAAAPAWLPAAVTCWVLVIAGLVAETVRRERSVFPPASTAGRLGERLLDLLTGWRRRRGGPRAIEPVALGSALKQRVFGQDETCEEIARHVYVRASMASAGKPLGVFLLAGPPGTGKTLLGQTLAAVCQRHLLQFDMTQFTETHAASQMFGVPPGYVGSDRNGRLVAGLAEYPEAVVLLDEVEKAHPDILRKFLVAWNDGTITDSGSGRRADCSGAIFVLTSNAASDALVALTREHGADARVFHHDAKAALRRAGFAPEFLDRIDRIFVLSALTGGSVLALAAAEARSLVRACRLELAGEIDPQIFAAPLARQRRDGPRSSREVARWVEELIGSQLVAARAAGTRRVKLVAEPDGIAAVAS